MKKIKFETWVEAARPKTLFAAIAPVVIGFSIALKNGEQHYISAILTLFSALLIQIMTNFVNDYADFKKGKDTAKRIGPVRVTQAGLVSPKQMRRLIILTILLIIIVSSYLVLRGGIPILIIGVLSIISGILYTAGPKPLGYIGLGDIFVFVFFGPIATAGTYYVQSLHFDLTSFFAGFGPGLLSVAILVANNIRDRISDEETGKDTLIVMLGRKFGNYEYLLSVGIALVLPLILFFLGAEKNLSFLTLILIIPVIKPVKILFSGVEGKTLLPLLAYTGKILLLYSLIFSIGWLIPIS